jgi:hypothetical protein
VKNRPRQDHQSCDDQRGGTQQNAPIRSVGLTLTIYPVERRIFDPRMVAQLRGRSDRRMVWVSGSKIPSGRRPQDSVEFVGHDHHGNAPAVTQLADQIVEAIGRDRGRQRARRNGGCRDPAPSRATLRHNAAADLGR